MNTDLFERLKIGNIYKVNIPSGMVCEDLKFHRDNVPWNSIITILDVEKIKIRDTDGVVFTFLYNNQILKRTTSMYSFDQLFKEI